MSDTITCEWCAEEILAASSRCPKCQGSISPPGRRIQGSPLAARPAPQQSRPKPPAGWYDDPKMVDTRRYWDGEAWTEHRQEKVVQPPAVAPATAATPSAVAGSQPRPAVQGGSYVVLQVILKEKFWGTGSGNLTELEGVLNRQAALGYRLHTITTASSGSKGLGGGDRIQATMVFERI